MRSQKHADHLLKHLCFICESIRVYLWGRLFARTLTIAFGLIGIDALHAVKDVFGVGTFNGGFAGPRFVAAGSGRGIAWQLTTACFIGLELVDHTEKPAGTESAASLASGAFIQTDAQHPIVVSRAKSPNQSVSGPATRSWTRSSRRSQSLRARAENQKRLAKKSETPGPCQTYS